MSSLPQPVGNGSPEVTFMNPFVGASRARIAGGKDKQHSLIIGRQPRDFIIMLDFGGDVTVKACVHFARHVVEFRSPETIIGDEMLVGIHLFPSPFGRGRRVIKRVGDDVGFGRHTVNNERHPFAMRIDGTIVAKRVDHANRRVFTRPTQAPLAGCMGVEAGNRQVRVQV